MIGFGDPFHIDNLAMTHTIKAAFGETERDNHQQIHNQQCFQNLYDIYSKDREGGQQFVDEVLSDSPDKLKIKAVCESQQQWLANQRNATWVLYYLSFRTSNNTIAMNGFLFKVHDNDTSLIRRMVKNINNAFYAQDYSFFKL